MENKSYVVIARKYRPQSFDDVIGQDHVATTLKNAIELKRIGHAYLFTGPRGVGKTSMARIFAKALNCKNGPTTSPCGKCQGCLEIEGARSLDVLEIDGASNRGIDEIRTLRENVKFAPAAGNFKIYIIDEVHQITTDGFNALLKTLEEPPAHVKFIFATTSAQKVPATILSRCQRFDFRRITTELIAATLKEICKKEKIKVDDEALFAIAKAADGSLRDSQSILDQIASSGQDKIHKEDVVRSLGSLEEDKILEIMGALAGKDARQALLLLNAILDEGKDPTLFMEKLLEHVRNLLFLAVSDKLAELIDAADSYKKELLKQKNDFSKEDLFYFFQVIAHTLQIMKRFEMKRIPLEIALVKLCDRSPLKPIAEVLDDLKNLERKESAPDRPKPAISLGAAAVRKPVRAEKIEEERDEEELPKSDEEIRPAYNREESNASLDTLWQPLIGLVKKDKISLATYLAEGEPRGIVNGIAKISFPANLSFHRETLEVAENKKLIEKHLASLLDQYVRIEFDSVEQLSRPKTAFQSPEQGAASAGTSTPVLDAASEEKIKNAMNMFGGKIIQ